MRPENLGRLGNLPNLPRFSGRILFLLPYVVGKPFFQTRFMNHSWEKKLNASLTFGALGNLPRAPKVRDAFHFISHTWI